MKLQTLATVIDSHTGGEPTRVVIEGGPDLGHGPMEDQLKRFQRDHDAFRRSIMLEPRGSDVLVGAILRPANNPSNTAGVLFFNNVGYLGMCGHGTIGVMVTLAHLGRIQPGIHCLETPVGVVTAELHPDGSVSVTNVPSYRHAAGVRVVIADGTEFTGDVAWGGNWFYLVSDHGRTLELREVEALTGLTWEIRRAINAQGYPLVDHVELFATPPSGGADSRNFVLCPGKAYDRSPCGTGTSAKLACLAADGKLAPTEPWIQESILGSRFIGRYRWTDQSRGIIEPTITGTAYITGESRLWMDPSDPFGEGIHPGAA
jgi:4-hydroxyproline epimerase